MSAAILDLTLEQGSDFSKHFIYRVGGNPLDLTGYTLQGQIRARPSAAEVLATFSFAFDTPRSTGGFTMVLSAAASNAIPVGDEANLTLNRAYYDVLLVTPSPELKATRILQGRVVVSPGVTRS